MSVRHGFASAWFGLRTRSFGRGGRRIGDSFVEAPFGGIVSFAQISFLILIPISIPINQSEQLVVLWAECSVKLSVPGSMSSSKFVVRKILALVLMGISGCNLKVNKASVV